MKKKFINVLCTGFLIFSVIGTADAALQSRLGGQAVYDTDLDVTWLSNANAAAGTVFDDGISSTDGQMSWDNAKAWAASLTIGGFTDWRLPTAFNRDGVTTCEGHNCTESEMGHLYYIEFGGSSVSGEPFSNPANVALFSNINILYWYDTETSPTQAWGFDFIDNGNQASRFSKDGPLNAWAVRSGDVGVVPIPAAIWLFGSGVLGILGYSRRKIANL